MTDHPKPIARYRLCNDVHVDRYERGSAQQYWDVLKNQTDVVLVRDHEAALAAGQAKIANLESRLRAANNTKQLMADELNKLDARIAELEEGREGYEAGCRDIAQDALDELTRLRTAIEAKAREFAEKGQQADQRCAAAQRGNDAVKVNATAMEAATYAECASELRALLDKKP